VSDFLRREIASATNIKSKPTRKAVESGLRKLLSAYRHHGDGKSYFTDGEDVVVEDYEGVSRVYHCGKEYRTIEISSGPDLMLVVVDANGAAIGFLRGEKVQVLWEERSMVPRKHKCGGQSQRRFERDRERALLAWLRSVAETMTSLDSGLNLLIGGPGMTKLRLVYELPTELQGRVVEMRSAGYTDENGLWELARLSRYD
jgi:peptide chain release factor subunit 1